jgi:hypothetical protein
LKDKKIENSELQNKDQLLKRYYTEALKEELILKKVGRNDPCPCGSGKKYKKCCLKHHEKARSFLDPKDVEKHQRIDREKQTLSRDSERGFTLLFEDRINEARELAFRLIKTYPNDDRFHEIAALSHLYSEDFDSAIEICKMRWEVAREEKTFFLKYGHHRSENDEGSRSVLHYTPEVWLTKYWVSLKGRAYKSLLPAEKDKQITHLVAELLNANDRKRFPQEKEEGYRVRREALDETIESLKTKGTEAVPYLLNLLCRYGWAVLFVPEILFHDRTLLSIRALIELSMFDYPQASQQSLKYLESLNEEAFPCMKEAISSDRDFDPIKLGIISVLGNIRIPESYHILLELLDHDETRVASCAGAALGVLGDTRAIPKMIEADRRLGGNSRIKKGIDQLKEKDRF